ncbi:hypothetical protein P9D56_25545, partial [Peribacillus simplex]|uniref:hypothetical protein n=1 Tax=Peribacillus simplex TaxID=1478 RepID=UPI002DBE1DD9
LQECCPLSSLRNSTTPLTWPSKNSPYSIRERAIDYSANNLVEVALPAFLTAETPRACSHELGCFLFV